MFLFLSRFLWFPEEGSPHDCEEHRKKENPEQVAAQVNEEHGFEERTVGESFGHTKHGHSEDGGHDRICHGNPNDAHDLFNLFWFWFPSRYHVALGHVSHVIHTETWEQNVF